MTDRGKRRLPGTRVKHRAKMNWIKMYDKAVSVLRVETVINEPEAFNLERVVGRGGVCGCGGAGQGATTPNS